MRLRGNKIAILGVMASVGILLSYIETFIYIPVKVPGIRVGLSNIVTMLALYLFGPIEALWVLITRVLISGFLFGSGMSLLFSFAGALASVIIMILLYKSKHLSCVGVSVIAGVVHNCSQLIVAILVVENTYIGYYFPLLIITGVLAGSIVGVLSNILINRIRQIIM